MTQNSNRIDQLLGKLETLVRQQEYFQKEINELRKELYTLKAKDLQQEIHQRQQSAEEVKSPVPVPSTSLFDKPKLKPEEPKVFFPPPPIPQKSDPSFSYNAPVKSNLEKFIGENLINKIGIIITVLGVGIGTKYSIEHDLISPLTRIILGYLVGIGLMGFGIKLKKNYHDLSAVLVSGAMAIMYFLTFAAYSFYNLIPQVLTFILMLFFTVFTVIAAINYNRQIIALLGLVGAYAVPFLLSDGSGKVLILFSYMTIINIGILILAFKKYWKELYYVSFVISWLIFSTWLLNGYNDTEHFFLAFVFLSIFFFTFYTMFLAFKLFQNKQFERVDIFLLLANSFVFYLNGYSLLSHHADGDQLLGLFTICNAVIHFGVCYFIYNQKLADRNLFYLVAGLVLVFITIAVPVQLDGNWVTLVWIGEAALLFWIGRTKQVPVYEKLSYPLMLLASISLVQDWNNLNTIYSQIKVSDDYLPILNVHFLSSMLFAGALLFINIISNKNNSTPAYRSDSKIRNALSIALPGLFLVVLYFSFDNEIKYYWNQLFMSSEITLTRALNDYPETFWNDDYNYYKEIWHLNFTMLFLSLVTLYNLKKVKNIVFGQILFLFSVLTLIIFHSSGLYILSELRETYLNHTLSDYYQRSIFNIGLRYISFAFVGLLLFTLYKYYKNELPKNLRAINQKSIDGLFAISILWILSSELLNWMDIAGSSSSYKLGLSLFWGTYSLVLISLGIGKNKQHLRLGAIGLFGITLIKLFFYDIADMNTIAKTIVFVSLGILLLIISFLYNKYKHLIGKENEM